MAYSDRQSTNFNMFNEPKSRCSWAKNGNINKAIQRVYVKSGGVLKHVRRIITKSSLSSASGSAGSQDALTDPLKTVYPQRTMHLVLNNGISAFQKRATSSTMEMALSFGLSCQQQAQSATTYASPAAGGAGYVGFNSGANGPYGRGDRVYFPIGWTGKISYWVSGIARSVIMSQPAAQGSEIGTGTMQMGWNSYQPFDTATVNYVHDGSQQNLGGNYYSPDNTNPAQRMPLLSPSQAHANVPNYRWWEFDDNDAFTMYQLLANTSFNFDGIATTMGWTRGAGGGGGVGSPAGLPTNTAYGTQLTRLHRENEAALYPVRYGLLNHGAPNEGQLSNIVSNTSHLVPNYTDEGDEGYNFPNHYYYPPLTSPWIGMMIRWPGTDGASKIRINPAWGTTNDGSSWSPIQQNRWVDAPGVALHMAVTTLGDIQPVLYTATQARTDLVNDQLNLFPRRVGAPATINSPISDVAY